MSNKHTRLATDCFLLFSLYSKLKKEEEERELEWAKKYRDRVWLLYLVRKYYSVCVCTHQARERRDDKNPDYSGVEESLPSASTYRAVAPGLVDP